jgi:putative transposase
MIPPPVVSTIHAALDRNGLVKRRKRRRYKAAGTPFAAPWAMFGLSRLAVWWLRLGIRLQQQERFEDFIRVYNQQRPHQALGGLYPAEIYTPSARPYQPPQDPDYPFHDRTVRVTRCGRICRGSRKINLSVSLAEQLVGIREVDDQVWQVSFLEYDLGYFDRDEDRVEPGPNPFAPDTVLTMCPE